MYCYNLVQTSLILTRSKFNFFTVPLKKIHSKNSIERIKEHIEVNLAPQRKPVLSFKNRTVMERLKVD